jgi:hypothetical protein
LIELPHLNDAIEVLDQPLLSLDDSEKRRLRVKKRELFDDFTDFDIDEEKDEDFLKNLWNTIQIEAANTSLTILLYSGHFSFDEDFLFSSNK